MVSIPKHVQEFMSGKMGWVATATREGVPNATPKGSVRVLDDQHVIFADLFSLKTRQNLEQNPQVAVTVVDRHCQGYQLKGTAELISSGPLFEQFAAQLKQAIPSLAPPQVCGEDQLSRPSTISPWGRTPANRSPKLEISGDCICHNEHRGLLKRPGLQVGRRQRFSPSPSRGKCSFVSQDERHVRNRPLRYAWAAKGIHY